MPFIHHTICISTQDSFPNKKITEIKESRDNLLKVTEPDYPGIPAGLRRRMGKSIRMLVGSALPVLEKNHLHPDGIVIGTSNGGMEDCLKFLTQILEYKEGLLTPGNFVQSTPNAAAAQLAMITKNHHYNITHVNRGLAFENAMLDTMMLLIENPNAEYLVGAVDEISDYNYNIDRLAGCYREKAVSNTELLNRPEIGTIAGEGSFVCVLNNKKENASAKLLAIKTIHTDDLQTVLTCLDEFLKVNDGSDTDLLISGEDGDSRLTEYYRGVEKCFNGRINVRLFKHLCGDYSTASSFAVWLAANALAENDFSSFMVKDQKNSSAIKKILIYNNFRGLQHSFILMSAVS